MDLHFIQDTVVSDHNLDELDELLGRSDGFLWLDVPEVDDNAALVLSTTFGLHAIAINACQTRNHLPAVHGYDEHLFFVLFSPLLGAAGHVHLLELDVVVGLNYLITVHGPLNPNVDPIEALQETGSVLRRIREGKVHAQTPGRAAYAIGSAIARRQRALLASVAEKIPAMESRVMQSPLRNPEDLLEELFLVRHELTTARTMSAQSHDVFARALTLERWIPPDDRPYIRDLAEQFERVRSLADSESHMLFGVIELYQTKVHTKMSVAGERLAVIATLTLPITAISSVYGMNVIVNDHTRPVHLAVVLLIMVVMTAVLLRWAKRQGWW